jgi:hypothetical protein
MKTGKNIKVQLIFKKSADYPRLVPLQAAPAPAKYNYERGGAGASVFGAPAAPL